MSPLVADKYRLTRLLGEGGMGEVWYAEHVTLGRAFAVKLMKPGSADDPGSVARFRREVQAVGRLRSEHVVAGLDCGRLDDGRLFLVMEHVEGETLSALLARETKLPVARAVELVRQACSGVAAAHAEGIVHRDLKPANLLLAPTQNGGVCLKVLDFGVAKVLRDDASHTATGQPVGTALYMAPEQARGDAVDARADVYALGVILFEALSGRLPHPGASFSQVLHHLFTQPALDLDAVAPGLPSGLVAVVRRALADDPGERFQSVVELDEALRDFVPGRGSPLRLVPARPLPVSDPTAGDPTLDPETPPPARVPSESPVARAPSTTGAGGRRAGSVWVAFAALGVAVGAAALALRASTSPADVARPHAASAASLSDSAPASSSAVEAAPASSSVPSASASASSPPSASGAPSVASAAPSTKPPPKGGGKNNCRFITGKTPEGRTVSVQVCL